MSAAPRHGQRLFRSLIAGGVLAAMAACRPGEPEVAGSARFAEPLPVDATLTVRLVPEQGAPGAPLFELREAVSAGTRQHDFVLRYDADAVEGVRYALRGRLDGSGLLWLGEGDDDLRLDARGVRARLRLAAP